MRLNGWQRIGIVASVCWMVGAFMYQRNVDVVAEPTKRYQSVFKSCEADKNVARNCYMEAIDAERAALRRAFEQDRFIAAYELAFLPVVLFWLSVFPITSIVG